jgi:hypothetical protein
MSYYDNLKRVLDDYLFRLSRVELKNSEITYKISDLTDDELEWTVGEIDMLNSKFDLQHDFVNITIDPKNHDIAFKIFQAGTIKTIATRGI